MSIPNIWKTTEKAGGYIDLTSFLLDHRMIFIRDELIIDLASLVTMQMFALSQSNEPISLYINCCGGSILGGLAIVDMINAANIAGVSLYTYCIGQ